MNDSERSKTDEQTTKYELDVPCRHCSRNFATAGGRDYHEAIAHD